MDTNELGKKLLFFHQKKIISLKNNQVKDNSSSEIVDNRVEILIHSVNSARFAFFSP